MTAPGTEGVEIHVNGADGSAVGAGELREAVLHTLRAEGVEAGELSLTLLDDAGMAELNERYLDRRGSTDVLAFSLGEGGEPLGDVYLGRERAEAQARELGVDVGEELIRLAVHGTLHVLGWDHPEGPDRTDSPMFARQEELVSELRDRRSSVPDAGAGAP